MRERFYEIELYFNELNLIKWYEILFKKGFNFRFRAYNLNSFWIIFFLNSNYFKIFRNSKILNERNMDGVNQKSEIRKETKTIESISKKKFVFFELDFVSELKVIYKSSIPVVVNLLISSLQSLIGHC